MAKLTLPSNTNLQKRYSYQVDHLFGVDYTNKKLDVQNYRAIDSQNYIIRNNILQKRYGIKQVQQLDSSLKVHNVWSFEDTLNNKHYIANVSGSLYEINPSTFAFTAIDYPNGNNALLDREVSAFPTNNRLYILGGKKYLICYLDEESSSLKIENVVGSQFVYTPTTTIGITPVDYDFGSGHRSTLDSVNLLTYWRKNKFVTGSKLKKSDGIIDINVTSEFQLDSPITFKDREELDQMTLDIEFYDNDTEQFEVDQNSSIRIAHLNAVFCKGLNLNGINGETEDKLIQDPTIEGVYVLVNYDEGDFNTSYIESLKTMTVSCNSSGESQGFRIYGYINLSGSVVLFNDYNNPNSENNCTFTFPCYSAESYDNNYIDTCFIGKVYNSNNINSLFVAGNPTYPARDWHSETINASALSEEEAERITVKDLVYFPDESYCDYGEDNDNPILGYDVLGTGDLLVMKKYQTYEPTIYFRTGQLVAVKSDIGETLTDLVGATLYEPEYSLTVGNIGVSLNDYMKIVNYNGDTIFIGNDKKLDGLSKETKSYDNQRYAYSRSYLIDKYLHDIDLTNSFIYQDSDCLYFVVGNEMFVNKYLEDPTESYMEWYHLTYNHKFVSMFEIEGKLYLSSDEGKIFLFRNKDVYYDETFYDFSDGEVLSTIDTNEITLPSSKISNCLSGDILELEEPIKCCIGTIGEDYTLDLTNRVFTILNSELITKLGDTELISYQDQTYILRRTSTTTYDVSSYVPEILLLSVEEAYLLKSSFEIENVDYTNSKIKIKDFTFAENGSSYGRLFHRENVSCYYVTSPILFNDTAMVYFKNIWQFVMANDTNEPNETTIEQLDNAIGYNESPYVVSMKDNKGINFANIDFNMSNLIQGKVPVKYQTIYKKILKRPYVVLRFSNNNDTNSVLSRISFVYSLGSRIR